MKSNPEILILQIIMDKSAEKEKLIGKQQKSSITQKVKDLVSFKSPEKTKSQSGRSSSAVVQSPVVKSPVVKSPDVQPPGDDLNDPRCRTTVMNLLDVLAEKFVFDGTNLFEVTEAVVHLTLRDPTTNQKKTVEMGAHDSVEVPRRVPKSYRVEEVDLTANVVELSGFRKLSIPENSIGRTIKENWKNHQDTSVWVLEIGGEECMVAAKPIFERDVERGQCQPGTQSW